MNVPLAILVIFGCLAASFGLPASTSTSDPSKDVEVLPPNTFGDTPVIVDTGYNWNSPFGSLFDNIESIMTRMRQQMESVFNRIPSVYSGPNGTEWNFSTNLPDDVDPSKVNKTSVTKVIDGHKVIINDTEYKNSNENGGSFFHIRVVDIKPTSEEGQTTEKPSIEELSTKSTTLVKDRESIENSLENEIQKSPESRRSKQKRYANLETFDSVDYIEPIDNEIDNNIEVINRRWDSNRQRSAPGSFNNYNQRYPQSWFPFPIPFAHEILTHRDTYRRPSAFQNDIRAPLFPQISYTQNRYPQDSFHQISYPQNRYPQTGITQNRFGSVVYPQSGIQQVSYLQNGMPQTRYPQNTVPQIPYPQNAVPQENYQQSSFTQTRLPQVNYAEPLTASRPFDLSRDTYVNEILAQSGAPTNPDAEIIDINALPGEAANRFRYPR